MDDGFLMDDDYGYEGGLIEYVDEHIDDEEKNEPLDLQILSMRNNLIVFIRYGEIEFLDVRPPPSIAPVEWMEEL